MAVYAMVVTNLQFGRIDIIGADQLAKAIMENKKVQSQIDLFLNFYKTVIGNSLWKVAFPSTQYTLAIKIFEALRATVMIENDYGHDLTWRQAAF